VENTAASEREREGEERLAESWVEETHKKYIFQHQREECKTFPGGYISRGIYCTVKEAHIHWLRQCHDEKEEREKQGFKKKSQRVMKNHYWEKMMIIITSANYRVLRR